MRHPATESDEIFIVEDDSTISELLSVMLRCEGYQVTAFSNGQAFLDVARMRTPACVVLDVYLPGRTGLEIINHINGKKYGAPIIVMSGKATIPMAVEAVKAGAFDIVEKPFDPEEFVAHIGKVIAAWRQRTAGGNGKTSDLSGLEFPGAQRLTPREREVLAEIIGASSNKEAGRHLGLSPRTVEVHRAHIMMKLGAKNTADLVRLVLSNQAVE